MLNSIDKKIAFIGTISVSLMALLLYTRYGAILWWSYNIQIYLIYGLFVVVSCVFWLLFSDKTDISIFKVNKNTTILSPLFWTFTILASLLIFFPSAPYQRSIVTLCLISTLAGFVIIEIFTSSLKRANLILLKIVVLGALILLSQSLIMVSISGSDAWYHQAMFLDLQSEGFLPLSYSYSKIPLFSVFSVISSICLNLDYQCVSILIGLTQIICFSIFIFLIGRSISKDTRIGLLSAFIVTIGSRFIGVDYRPIPFSFALIFMIIIIYYLLLKKNNFIMLIFLTVATVLTHTLVSAFILFYLLVITISYIVVKYNLISLNGSPFILKSFMISAIIINVISWIYISSNFNNLIELIRTGFDIDNFILLPRNLVGYVSESSFIEQLISNAQILLYAFAFIGVLFFISKKGSKSFLMVLGGVFPLLIGIFSSFLGYGLLWYRWYYFAEIMLSVPLAVSIFLIYNFIKKHVLKNIMLLLFIPLVFIMILNPIVADDCQIIAPTTGVRYALSSSEFNSATFLASHTYKISTDSDYANSFNLYFSRQYENLIYILDDSLYTQHFIHDNTLKIIRAMILDAPFRLHGVVWRISYDPLPLLNLNFNRLYDNSEVIAFL